MVRALTAAAACCLSLALAGPAAAASFAPGSPELATALQVGERLWGGMPCGGQVAFSWRDEDPAVNATSYWSPGFTNCEIVFNRSAGMGALKFCTIMAHELGHLHGRGHSGDPDDLMAAYYSAPLPACSSGATASSTPVAEFRKATTFTAPEARRRHRAALRRCNRRHTRRAIRRCKRTMARRAIRRRHVARSVTAISPATLLAPPPASDH